MFVIEPPNGKQGPEAAVALPGLPTVGAAGNVAVEVEVTAADADLEQWSRGCLDPGDVKIGRYPGRLPTLAAVARGQKRAGLQGATENDVTARLRSIRIAVTTGPPCLSILEPDTTQGRARAGVAHFPVVAAVLGGQTQALVAHGPAVLRIEKKNVVERALGDRRRQLQLFPR